MKAIDFTKFKDISYDSFRVRALDDSLSDYEKVGFPDEYRAGREEAIFDDICRKLPRLTRPGAAIVDLGPGCGGLARRMIDLCRQYGHRLAQIDCPEMLAKLPEAAFITKVPGRFPADCGAFVAGWREQTDCVLAYSILPCVFEDGNIFNFIDTALSLLAPGGACLLGDIPNVSKRKRFFSSAAGIQFHQQFMETREPPRVEFNTPEPGKLDDAVVLAILARCRAAGFDAFVVPQPPELPLANRREDVLVIRP
jgi:hypothetical protein